MLVTYFEGVLEALWVDLGEGGLESVSDQLLDLREDVTMEVKVEFGLLGADDLREVLPAELVAVLELAVVVRLLLDSVVCQVDELVCHVIEGVLSAARSNVPILVAVALQASIDARQQAEAAEVELALVDQQRVVNVLLNDEGTVVLLVGPADDGLHFADRLHHSDALAAVRVLTWLDDPSVLRGPVPLPDLLDRVFVVGVYLTGILLILPLLFVSSVPLISVELLNSFLGLPLAGTMALLHLVEVVGELSELRVVHAVLCMKRQREHLKGVLAERLVVLPHVHKHALLVRQLLVLFKFIVEAEWEGDPIDPSGLLWRGCHQCLLLDRLFRLDRGAARGTTRTPGLPL